MNAKAEQTVWVVVLVQRGFPALAEAYQDLEMACHREQILRKGMNLDYDEVGLFEVEIDRSTYVELSPKSCP